MIQHNHYIRKFTYQSWIRESRRFSISTSEKRNHTKEGP
jgi:hypothetical protein